MPPTTSYKRGDILLVPFPFSDQTSAKQRPAVVVSVDAFQQHGPDLFIMAITTQIGGSLGLGEFLIRDWKSAGLIKPSAVKAALSTLEASLVRRQLGRLSDYDLAQLNKCLRDILGL